MVAIELDFPPEETERKVVVHESGVSPDVASRLVDLAQAIRRLESTGLREVASTRLLVAAAQLSTEGVPLAVAGRSAIAGPLTDDPALTAGLFEMVDAYLGDPE
jgi:nitric oxide reductase NorQ protein